MDIDIEMELQSMGLRPKTWPSVLETVKSRLSPADWEKFSRLHKSFVAYRSETTLSRFYGFVFSHGLQLDINCFRYGRLLEVLKDLLPEISPGQTILDVGAGAGIIAALIRRHGAPKALVVQDSCAEVRDALRAQGFIVLPHPSPGPLPDIEPVAHSGTLRKESIPSRFDLILCVDSLGELNSDDDGMLAKRDAAGLEALPQRLEERYGFAHKLSAWKGHLAPQGRILLWEPFAYQKAMEWLAVILRAEGWHAQLVSRSPTRNYLELRLP